MLNIGKSTENGKPFLLWTDVSIPLPPRSLTKQSEKFFRVSQSLNSIAENSNISLLQDFGFFLPHRKS